ncbi:MAG: SMC-Scp complex subunit ScpB [Candidatus Aenigmarchaeota archaeon]|nr:SMC-Scp complex subunit ScpB [Candidatus Aenigmarchaeota archaeon]
MRRKTVEAALFLASGPITAADLVSIVECSAAELEDEILALKEKYGEDSGIKLIDANQSYQFIVNPLIVHKVKQLSPYRDLSPGLVKALSIIAFKGPLKQSLLVNTVGNRAYEYTGELEKRGLITAKKEGRTRILKVTKLFVDYFGQAPEKRNLEKFLDSPKAAEALDKIASEGEEGPEGGGIEKLKKTKKPEPLGDDQLIAEQEMYDEAEEIRGEETVTDEFDELEQN